MFQLNIITKGNIVKNVNVHNCGTYPGVERLNDLYWDKTICGHLPL